MKNTPRQPGHTRAFLSYIIMLLLLILLPFAGFILGMQYQKSKTPPVIKVLPSPIPTPTLTPTPIASPSATIQPRIQ